MPNVYQDAVVTKYNIFNSLFLSLPFQDIYRTGTLLPLLVQASEEGFAAGKSPQQIISNFCLTQVEEALNDENSSVQLSQAKMSELKIFKGDAIFIKGKKRK